jgi:hypothetical protein
MASCQGLRGVAGESHPAEGPGRVYCGLWEARNRLLQRNRCPGAPAEPRRGPFQANLKGPGITPGPWWFRKVRPPRAPAPPLQRHHRCADRPCSSLIAGGPGPCWLRPAGQEPGSRLGSASTARSCDISAHLTFSVFLSLSSTHIIHLPRVPAKLEDEGKPATNGSSRIIEAESGGGSSVGRAPAFQAGCRGFESRPPLQDISNATPSCAVSVTAAHGRDRRAVCPVRGTARRARLRWAPG